MYICIMTITIIYIMIIVFNIICIMKMAFG